MDKPSLSAPLELHPSVLSFQRILYLLKPPWVYSFLFPTEPQPALLHAAIYASLSSPHPSTAVLQIESVFPTPLSPSYSLDEKMRLLFVPSFSNGSITVGFHVHERLKTNTVNTQKLFISRTVRDDISGVLISISQDLRFGLTEIKFVHQSSSASRTQTFLVVQTKYFMRAIHQCRTASFNPRKFQRAIIFAFYSTEQKSCPMCNNLITNTTCLCPLSMRPKRHSMDYDTDYNNDLTFSGAFSGLCTVDVYWNGTKIFNASVPSRCIAEPIHDRSIFTRLSQWGFTNSAAIIPINISRMQVPFETTRTAVDALIDGIIEGGNQLQDTSDLSHQIHNPPVVPQLIDYSLLNIFDWETDPFRETLPHPVVEVTAGHTSDIIDPLHEEEESGPQIPPKNLTNNAQLPTTTSTITQSQSMAMIPRLLPSGTLHMPKVDGKTNKAQLQKMRNRVAAHRSNEKRKLAFQELKTDLAQLTRLAAKLKEKQQRLRQDNLRLRKLQETVP